MDLRTLEEVPPMRLRFAQMWPDAEFVWKRYRAREDWSHDHCLVCSACICEHRERDPYDKPGPVVGGHYRHAFYAKGSNGTYTWVCRSCFKRMKPIVNWSSRRSNSTSCNATIPETQGLMEIPPRRAAGILSVKA